MRPLRILLLTDDRPGHYHLADGVAAAIQRRRPTTVTRLRVRRRRWMPGRYLAKFLQNGGSPALLLRAGYGLAPQSLPEADLILSAGGETLAANVAAARVLHAYNIFCGSLRRVPPEALSLVISSYARHATLPRHLVTLKPSNIDPDALGPAKRRAAFSAFEPPRVAGLLIGGDSGTFRYTPDDWRRLVRLVEETHARFGTLWVVSTSRRSPALVADLIEELKGRAGGPIQEFIDFRTAGPGTLPRLFAMTEALLCTEDSSTMLSEAICARLPVVGVSPADHTFTEEEREYRSFLRSQNWCRFLALAEITPEDLVAALGEIRTLEVNHLDRLADELRQRLPEIFAGD